MIRCCLSVLVVVASLSFTWANRDQDVGYPPIDFSEHPECNRFSKGPTPLPKLTTSFSFHMEMKFPRPGATPGNPATEMVSSKVFYDHVGQRGAVVAPFYNNTKAIMLIDFTKNSGFEIKAGNCTKHDIYQRSSSINALGTFLAKMTGFFGVLKRGSFDVADPVYLGTDFTAREMPARTWTQCIYDRKKGHLDLWTYQYNAPSMKLLPDLPDQDVPLRFEVKRISAPANSYQPDYAAIFDLVDFKPAVETTTVFTVPHGVECPA